MLRRIVSESDGPRASAAELATGDLRMIERELLNLPGSLEKVTTAIGELKDPVIRVYYTHTLQACLSWNLAGIRDVIEARLHG
jgi:hypothetical protein